MILAETLIPTYPSFTQMMLFSALGFGVVMTVLFVQSIFMALIGKIFMAIAKNKAK